MGKGHLTHRDCLIKIKNRRRYSKCPKLNSWTFICLFPPKPCVFANGPNKGLFVQVRSLAVLVVSLLFLTYLAWLHVLSVVPLKYFSNLFCFYLPPSYLLLGLYLSCLDDSRDLPAGFTPIYSYQLLPFSFYTISPAIFPTHVIHHASHNLCLTLVLCPTPFV